VMPKQRLSVAIAAILGGHAGGAVLAAAPAAQSGEIGEVIVTATRRSESLQDVPIAITALTADTLTQLNVVTLDDFVKYLPNVSTASKGPGQNEVYMRGLSTTQNGNQGSGSIGSFPNVALYLDDQSAQLPGRNLDIYAADLERIEVLEGPQGTLYGAGAQAGAIRYITNKPKLNVTEAFLSGGYAATAHGNPSTTLEAVVNLPLLQDRLAVRVVAYDDKRGGYIHNVAGTFARQGTDLGIAKYFGGVLVGNTVVTPGIVPPGSATVSNTNLVNHAYNPSSYKGARLSALYKFNDDWNLGLQQSFQTLEADGVFSYNPSLGDLNVQQYNRSYDRDKFEDTAWTLNGRIGALKAVYTGGYLTRNVEQLTDYTGYARGLLSAYYQCNGPAVYGTGPNICYSPSSDWHDIERNTHESHELRVTTPDDARLRAIVGMFYEDYEIQDSINWRYGSAQAGFAPFAPLAGTTVFDPSMRDPGVVFFNDITRGYTQTAGFGELAYDLVPKSLTLTVGTRLYRMDNFEKGSKDSAAGCRGLTAAQCDNLPRLYSVNLDVVTFADGSMGPLRSRIAGHKNRVNVSYKPIDGVMLYATYSEGFRPGGFNRGQGIIPNTSPLFNKFTLPYAFDTDQLKNYELGWKTTLLNRHLQFNGTLYEEKWSNVQMEIFAPTLYGNNAFTANGPDYKVRGFEGEVIYRVTEHLTLSTSFAWNHSEQVNAPQLIDISGKPVDLFPTPGIGSPLAQAPPFQGNARLRYEAELGSYIWHVQAAAQHSAHSYAQTITIGGFEPPNQPQNPWTTYDAAAGISRDTWDLELYGQNLTDARPQLYVNGFDFVHLITPSRPRVIGLRLSYRFSGKPTS
jgi:iron complex outermembrane recepter protein